MNQAAFKSGMTAVYAAHGRVPPSEAVLLAVWRRVESLPDAFMDWACRELADYDKLPGNLGLELARALYARWRAERAPRGPRRLPCPDCDPSTPGFFHWWRREGGLLRSGLIRCACNDDPAFDPLPRKNKAAARAEGLLVMPPDCKGGPAAFERGLSRAGV